MEIDILSKCPNLSIKTIFLDLLFLIVDISLNITIHPLEMIIYLIKLLCILVIFRNYLLNLEMAPKTAHKTLHTLKLVGYYIPFVFIAWEANLLHIAKSNSHFIDYYLFINKVYYFLGAILAEFECLWHA